MRKDLNLEDIIFCLLYSNPVEVESLNNIPQHHMRITPISPVSILQNSPLYSPVKDPPCSPSISLPSPLIHEESNEGFEMENYNVHIVAEEEEEVEMTTMWSSADSDEGIESEEGNDKRVVIKVT